MRVIHGIFKKKKLKIKPSKILLPKNFKLSWESVGGANKKRALLYTPSEQFLNNIEKYEYNRFLDIGRNIPR